MENTRLLEPGTLLADRYEVVRLLGQGGMGAVYLARDRRLSVRSWAVKEMWADALGADERDAARAQFEREASLLAALEHPALPRVTDFFSESGREYLVMDFVEGRTLEALIEAEGPVDAARAVAWGLQICDLLGYLHGREHPIILRDLKPGNVMIAPTGAVKVIDFGIARIFQPGRSDDTVALGTPGFAAPEQYGRGQTDARADLYGLGATLHYVLTGHDPGDQPFHFAAIPPLNPSVSAALDRAIRTALQPDAAARYQTAAQMAAAIRETEGRSAELTATLGDVGAAAETRLLTADAAAAARAGIGSAASSDTGPPASGIAAGAAGIRGGAAGVAPATGGLSAAPTPPAFDPQRLSFGTLRRGDVRRVGLRIRGEVDGVLTSTEPRWLRVEPHRVRGRDVSIQATAYTNALQEGREHAASVLLRQSRQGDLVLPVHVRMERARFSVWSLLAALAFTVASPFLGVLALVGMAALYYTCPLDERSALRPFFAVTLAASLMNTLFLVVGFVFVKPLITDLVHVVGDFFTRHVGF